MALSRSLWEDDELERIHQILRQWSICAMPRGILTVTPRCDRVRLVDFCLLIKRMLCTISADSVGAILFYFEYPQVPVDAWPIIERLVEVLSRRTGTRCTIVRISPDSRSLKQSVYANSLQVKGDRTPPTALPRGFPNSRIA